MTAPRIETDRLLLRMFERGDFDEYAALHADEPAARYIGGTLPRASAWRKFLQMPGAWALQGYGMFAVVDKHTGEWLGQAGPWQPEGWPGTEVGWGFKRAAWGRGYATEAAIAAIDWAFDNLGWTEVIHSIDPDNEASNALARRLGARNRGRGRLPEPFEQVAIDIWAQTRASWEAGRAARVQAQAEARARAAGTRHAPAGST